MQQSPTFPISIPDFITILKALDMEIMFQTPAASPAYSTTTSAAQNSQQPFVMKPALAVLDLTSQKEKQPAFQEAEAKFLLQQ